MADKDIDLKRLQYALQTLRETKRRGESVRAFAKGAGISYTYVAQMEGRVKNRHLKKAAETAPTILMLHRYLQRCGTTITGFFSEFEREEPGDMSPSQMRLLDTVRMLIRAGG